MGMILGASERIRRSIAASKQALMAAFFLVNGRQGGARYGSSGEEGTLKEVLQEGSHPHVGEPYFEWKDLTSVLPKQYQSDKQYTSLGSVAARNGAVGIGSKLLARQSSSGKVHPTAGGGQPSSSPLIGAEAAGAKMPPSTTTTEGFIEVPVTYSVFKSEPDDVDPKDRSIR